MLVLYSSYKISESGVMYTDILDRCVQLKFL